MIRKHLRKLSGLGLLLCTMAATTQADQRQLELREGEASWIDQANPHARNGTDPAIAVGAKDRASRGLIRFDTTTRKGSYDTITKAVLELTLADVKGAWENQIFQLHQVNNGRWGAGAVTWASINDSNIIMLGSGEPIRTAWQQPGCEGWMDRGAKLSEAKISSTDKGKTIRFEITDPTFLAILRNLAHTPDPLANGGFLITAPGLETKPEEAALFATWSAAAAQRPVLKLDVEGYMPVKTVLRYELETGGRVSIVIYNSDGKLARELLHGVERTAGTHEEGWDGKDEQGKVLPAGTYSWKLLRTPGLQAEYLMTLGTNPKTPWQVWPGNHNPVTTVATDESGIYFASGSNEGPPMMVKQSHDEKLLWTATHFVPFGGAQSLCADGGKVFLIESGSKRPHRLNAATGKTESTLEAIPAGNNALVHMDMAARNGRLLLSYYDKNIIRWFDFDGKPLGECTVAEPAGVVLLESGDALVISQGAVLRVPLGGKPERLIAATLLTAPWRLDVAANGDILVAESDGMLRWAQRDLKQAESTFPADKGRQVKRFGADGKLKAAYGRPGGRDNYGPYKPEDGFGFLLDIAATRDGGFLAVDLQGPNRTVAYDSRGTIVREWYGGQTYGVKANADPEDPSLVYLSYGWGGIIRYKVDYAKRTWKVDTVFDNGIPMWPVGDPAFHFFVRRREGKLLLFTSTTPAVFELDEKNGKITPMSVLSFPAGGGPNPPETILKQMKPDGNWKQYVYSWVDTNGNGQPEDDEFTFPGGIFRAGGMYLDQNFNYYLSLSQGLRQWTKQDVGYVRLAPQGFTKHGAPIYDNAKQEKLGEPPMDEYGFGQYGDVAIWKDETDGSVYVIYNTNDEKKFGQGFWSPRNGGNRVARWNAEGELEWVVGRHSATWSNAPGEGRHFWRIMGTTHKCVVVGDVEGGLQHVWDRDGLWVGRLLESPMLTKGVPPQAFEVCGEQFGGSLYTDPKTGEVLFYGSGINNIPVFRITGWDGWIRKAGTVKIKP